MAGWNDQSPRGGPMVKVDGFPGPLYPRDHPKGPSPDSDFVLALKRTAARCGAWPWNPAGWDDSYSNRFAHGDGWDDATHAGIEGLQHWSGTLEVTGNVGEKTFNFLRSVKVPQGRTHAGEMAMDSVAINLTNKAFNDSHPPPSSVKPVRELALLQAITQLGVKESPPESNLCKYTDWYGMVGPWCAMFVTWCYEQTADSATFVRGSRYAYVPYIVSDARNGRYGLVVSSSPKPGDLVCYDWQSNGEYDHVGLFEDWGGSSPSQFTAVEGNTSTSNDSNGGEVMRRTRDTRNQATVFVRVAEP